MVRIFTREGSGRQACGTGFVIDHHEDEALIATAKHCVSGRSLSVLWPTTRQTVTARLLARASADVALITAPGAPEDASGFALGDDPHGGDALTWCGHGSPQEPYQCYVGRVFSTQGSVVGIRGHVRHGDSGGPVFGRGGIVGLISAKSAGQVYVEPVSRIKALRASCPWPKLPRLQPQVPEQDTLPETPRACEPYDDSALRSQIAANAAALSALKASVQANASAVAGLVQVGQGNAEKIKDLERRLSAMENGVILFRFHGGPDEPPRDVPVAIVNGTVNIPPVLLELHRNGKVEARQFRLGDPAAIDFSEAK